MINTLKDPKTRAYIYRVVSALVPLLILTGVMVPGISEAVLFLVAAVLGVGASGLAVANTHPESAPDALEEAPEDNSQGLGE